MEKIWENFQWKWSKSLPGWGHYRVNWYAYRYCLCDSSILFLANTKLYLERISKKGFNHLKMRKSPNFNEILCVFYDRKTWNRNK